VSGNTRPVAAQPGAAERKTEHVCGAVRAPVLREQHQLQHIAAGHVLDVLAKRGHALAQPIDDGLALPRNALTCAASRQGITTLSQQKRTCRNCTTHSCCDADAIVQNASALSNDTACGGANVTAAYKIARTRHN